MKRHSQYAIAAALVGCFYFLYSFLVVSENEERATFLENLAEPQVVEDHLGSREPKITIIAIWVPRSDEVAAYVPYFFQSVEANPEVNLLFVQVDKRDLGCRTYSTAPNVKVSPSSMLVNRTKV